MINDKDLYYQIKELLTIGNANTLSKMAYNNIVNQIFMKGQEPINDDLDDNSAEAIKVMYKQPMALGCLYMFKYSPKSPTIIKEGSTEIDITDSLPFVLFLNCPNGNKELIRAINLNYCPQGLRYEIFKLLEIHDPDFFRGGCDKLLAAGKVPVSIKIQQFIGNDAYDIEKLIKGYLKIIYPKANTDVIFRTYNKRYMQQVIFMPPCLWPQLLFLTPQGKDYPAEIKKMWKMTGMDTAIPFS